MSAHACSARPPKAHRAHSYNNVKAIDQQGLLLRNSSAIDIGGLYLS